MLKLSLQQIRQLIKNSICISIFSTGFFFVGGGLLVVGVVWCIFIVFLDSSAGFTNYLNTQQIVNAEKVAN